MMKRMMRRIIFGMKPSQLIILKNSNWWMMGKRRMKLEGPRKFKLKNIVHIFRLW